MLFKHIHYVLIYNVVVNLTPNALRLLDQLGALQVLRDRNYGETIDFLEVFDVYSGKLAESSFRGPDGKGLGNPPYKVKTSMIGRIACSLICQGSPNHPWRCIERHSRSCRTASKHKSYMRKANHKNRGKFLVRYSDFRRWHYGNWGCSPWL